jgi:hypothetical protein
MLGHRVCTSTIRRVLGAAQHGNLVPQHGNLVPRHEQLEVLGCCCPAVRDQPAAEPGEDQVERAQSHG